MTNWLTNHFSSIGLKNNISIIPDIKQLSNCMTAEAVCNNRIPNLGLHMHLLEVNLFLIHNIILWIAKSIHCNQFAIIDFFLCIVKLYKEKTHRGYMRVSQQTAVSDHKTQMTSHPLKIAATAGIWIRGVEWFHICHFKELNRHKTRVITLWFPPGRGDIK